MIDYELSLLIAIAAFVYSQILTDAEMILNPVYNYFDKKTTHKGTGKKHWLFKMLMHCEKCVAGQFSLWLYLVFHFQEYNALNHILFITFTIFLAAITKNIYKQTQIENGNGN